MNEVKNKMVHPGHGARSIALLGLRAARQKAGLTQSELAELAGVARGTVHRLEILERGGYPRTLRKLATALGVAPVQLVRDHRPE
jgi:transcriptional regulator with XRE-family HTH domain